MRGKAKQLKFKTLMF